MELDAAEVKAPFGATNKNRFLYKNAGTFNVTGEMLDTIVSSSTTEYSLAGFFAKGDSKAVTRTKGLVHNGSTKGAHVFRLHNSEDSVTNTFVLGSGGLSFRDNLRSNSSCYPYFHIDYNKSAVLASSADWSFGANPVSGKDLNLELNGTVFVDTSDYDDRTVPHTIHVLNRIGSSGNVTVKGCGKLVFEHYSDFWGTLTVQDTATVAVNHGCGFTRSGDATVSSGAAIEVAQSGSVTFGKNLTVTLNGQKNIIVKITASEGKSAKGGANVLTAGGKFAGANVTLAEGAPKWVRSVRVENNEIVLEAYKSGMYIIVK